MTDTITENPNGYAGAGVERRPDLDALIEARIQASHVLADRIDGLRQLAGPAVTAPLSEALTRLNNAARDVAAAAEMAVEEHNAATATADSNARHLNELIDACTQLHDPRTSGYPTRGVVEDVEDLAASYAAARQALLNQIDADQAINDALLAQVASLEETLHGWVKRRVVSRTAAQDALRRAAAAAKSS